MLGSLLLGQNCFGEFEHGFPSFGRSRKLIGGLLVVARNALFGRFGKRFRGGKLHVDIGNFAYYIGNLRFIEVVKRSHHQFIGGEHDLIGRGKFTEALAEQRFVLLIVFIRGRKHVHCER